MMNQLISRAFHRYHCHVRSMSIDVHTHMYTPKYMDILQKRIDIPRVIMVNNQARLVILPGEDKEITTNIGRPIGPEYYNIETKLKYMNAHNIKTSIISLANPWLDFLHSDDATLSIIASELNDELENLCENSSGRIYGFATLPIKNSVASIKEIRRLKGLKHIKGVILGTPGAGKGLDDIGMRDVLHTLADANYPVFLHPHYGVGVEHYHDTGHALFLALGFPFETTVSVSRLIVTGTLDQVPHLKLLVAHAGAALPSLIGRLDSCVAHDHAISNRLLHEPSSYLKRMYFDAISYNTSSLQSLIDQVGVDRIMFGTDNPFFPPLLQSNNNNSNNNNITRIDGSSTDDDVVKWPSTQKVYQCIDELSNVEHKKLIIETNAKNLFNL